MNDYIRTKIIATIGPGTSSEESILSLINAGTTLFRINSSHETMESHAARIASIKKLAKSVNKFIPILLDLQGPKIRVGNLKEAIDLKDGTQIKLKSGMEEDATGIIPVDYSGIAKDVKKGDRILLDDGKLELKVMSIEKGIVNAKVIHGGFLKSRKGLNIPGATSSISAITKRDIEYIKFAVEQKVDYVALSFVREKDDIIKAKKYIKQFGGDIPVIAKIEKPQALENLESIIAASDGIMVARGDLGIEISPEKVPIVQKDIINKTNRQRKAVIVATQMLESMIEQPMPTRAEASDVANAIIDGTDAIMLSGETAVGKFASEAVKMMNLIAQNVEKSKVMQFNHYPSEAREIYEIESQAVCSAVIKMLDEIEISAIVAFTKTGYTAGLLSKAKPSVPIFAISDVEDVCQRLNLFWGVFPIFMECERAINASMLNQLDKMLLERTFIKPGDQIILTGSIPYIVTGKTNFIRLHQVGSTSTMY